MKNVIAFVLMSLFMFVSSGVFAQSSDVLQNQYEQTALQVETSFESPVLSGSFDVVVNYAYIDVGKVYAVLTYQLSDATIRRTDYEKLSILGILYTDNKRLNSLTYKYTEIRIRGIGSRLNRNA